MAMTNNQKLALRIAVYGLAMFLMGTGIALTVKAKIGLSPISSVNRTMLLICDHVDIWGRTIPVTHGMYSIMMNTLMFTGSFLVDIKGFKPKMFFQMVPAFFAGGFIDMNLWLMSSMNLQLYPFRIFVFVIGCAILSFSICLMLRVNIILMPNDGFVSVLVRRTKKQWGNIKTGLDLSLVVLSAILGLVFLNNIPYIREGTILNALLVGQFIRLIGKGINKVAPNSQF